MIFKLSPLIFTALAQVIRDMIIIGKRFKVSLPGKKMVIAFDCHFLFIRSTCLSSLV